MRHETGQPFLREVDEGDDGPEVAVDLDVGRVRRVAPAFKKATRYRRDRRFVAEYPHLERRTWPQKKALRNQTYRRGVDRALQPALGAVSAEIDDFAPAFPRRPRSPSRSRHGNIPLGQWVNDKLEKRLAYVGNNIGAKIRAESYRRRLIPFLESLLAGRRGHAVEIARYFAMVLDGLPNGGRASDTSRSSNFLVWRSPVWNRALIDLFDEQPEWEARLRAWIAEVAPPEAMVAEPAWRRIRRYRGRSAR
jgi:hypothetical protein